ncbi:MULTISPECIES: hypothetical protein [unclassified Nocardiopsis]|uniref:hypothetical protein n=1 Tax=unclassified Nocardiopsis TaxID=2649073 RepID=UPI0013582B4C|nr:MULTISPECIES: hypothetical protein [unclassified Nocardiopsis]
MRLHTTGVLLVGALVVGCTPSESEPDPRPSAPPEPTEQAPPEDLALEAYTSMWDVLVEEARKPEPDYSQLELYASGDALALVEHGLVAEGDEGVIARGEPTFSPEVVSAEDTHVEIEDCMDSTSWLREDAESGELVEPSPETPVLRRVDAGVSFDGLSWRVSDLRIWEIGSCDG